jgi:signal transduction histidine kinase
VPIVNAGVPDPDWQRAVRGNELFGNVRTANADVDVAIEALQQTEVVTTRRASHLADVLFATLAVLILLVGLGLARLHQRHLMAPLEGIRRTLRRLSDGELSARAVPAGPEELRAVAVRVNDLAEQTERLLAAEQARVAGAELLQAAANLLRDSEAEDDRDPAATGGRLAELIGTTFGADAVHGLVTSVFSVRWPAGAAEVDPAAVGELQAGRPVPGMVAVPLHPDRAGPSGLLCVVRPGREWTGDERRLLVALADEIDHAIWRRRLRLRQARLISELRTLDEQKDVFVSTVTHELRTPLTSILGYAEMLSEGDGLSPAERRGLDAILRNAHRLQATVGDLLLLDRSTDRAEAEPVPVDLAALATTLHADLHSAATAKDLRSELAAEPAWVRGDGAQLKRALRYLLENAIKFTPAGGRLECRLTTVESNVVVTVTDTGIGIPADDVPGLFTPFHRGANAMDQAVQGTGLGLAIVRTIVTEHGGTVAARSELDLGSTFTVTLPAVRRSEPVAALSTPGHG